MLESVRNDLCAAFDDDVSLAMFGSWARAELVEGSDNDWAVLFRDRHDKEWIEQLLERCRDRFGADPPGGQAIFGVAFAGGELIEQIGLEPDTNKLLTRRVLLLTESVTACGAIHEETRKMILRAYLDRNAKDYRPPRFLLNDLIRYWRTICVDYEGKFWGPSPDRRKRVLRNAKLRTSRKVLFAGALLPVLLCHRITSEHFGYYLLAQFRAPPVDNLAAAFLSVENMEEAGGRALLAYDRWIGLIGDPDKRRELEALTEEQQSGSDLFKEVREIGRELDEGLEALLFESGLAETTRKFGIF